MGIAGHGHYVTGALAFAIVAVAACVPNAAEEPGATADARRADAASTDGDSVAVYVIALQSNAVGGAHVADLPADLASYADPEPGVPEAYQLNCPKDGVDGACALVRGWGPLGLRPTGHFGIQPSAGRRLHERFGRIAIITTATNGTGVGAQWEPDMTPGKWQWHYMLEAVEARIAELPLGSRVAGVMLVGCEGDASNVAESRALDGELAYLIMRFRQEFGEVPVVISELNAMLPHAAAVRVRQHRVAEHVPGVTLVPTNDLVYRDGYEHYDAASFVTLGQRMADAFP